MILSSWCNPLVPVLQVVVFVYSNILPESIMMDLSLTFMFLFMSEHLLRPAHRSTDSDRNVRRAAISHAHNDWTCQWSISWMKERNSNHLQGDEASTSHLMDHCEARRSHAHDIRVTSSDWWCRTSHLIISADV